jgi:hypothetical protein
MLSSGYINWKIINLRLSGLVKILFLSALGGVKTIFLTRQLYFQISFAPPAGGAKPGARWG